MPKFNYEAQDKNQRLVRGVVSARTVQEAHQFLLGKGWQVRTVAEELKSVVGAVRAPVSSPVVVPQNLPFVSQPHSKPLPLPSVVDPPKLANVKTVASTERDRFFLFDQLAASQKAGLPLAQTLQRLSAQSNLKFREALQYTADATSNGSTIADCFASYPDLFPEDVVGMVKAGEAGGFLPDAFKDISEQNEQAFKFKNNFFALSLAVVGTIAMIPLALMIRLQFLKSWQIADSTGGSESGFTVAVKGIATAFMAILPWAILYFLCLSAIYFLIRSRKFKRLRHQFAAVVPLLRPRTMSEGLSRFSWVLGMVSRAGISPYRAMEFAIDSIPNVFVRDNFHEMASGMRENESLSTVISRSKYVPQEYAMIISNGELTGNVPGAMDSLTTVCRADFERANVRSIANVKTMTRLVVLTTGLLVACFIIYVWTTELPVLILEGFE